MFGPKELLVVIVIVILAPLYFLPSIVAMKHPHRGAIFVLNLFLVRAQPLLGLDLRGVGGRAVLVAG